jgi:EAL domain-containing protein (putative c-di-GMP-specific phosphodiesterase class I)/GGDEF domain-containing protein
VIDTDGDGWIDAEAVGAALASQWAQISAEPLSRAHSIAWQFDGRSLITTALPTDGSGAIQTATVDVSALLAGPITTPGDPGDDPLTGLANRAALVERIDSLVRRMEHDPAQIGVAVVRLDGDPTDVQVAEAGLRLERTTRAGDVAGRIGPAELAIVFGTPIGEIEARVAADRVIHRLGGVTVGLSFAEQPVPGADLLAAGRAAVDLAQESRLRVYVVDEADRSSFEWTRRRVDDLQLALELDQLEVHYQPVVVLATGRWRSVEALVRWRHPTEGLIPPEEFIPLAERTGLIGQVSERVMTIALSDLAGWQELGMDLAVAVNVSATDLLGDDFIDDVLRLSADAGVDPHGLRLELTETSVLADVGRATDAIAQLRHAGIRVSLDDFGTGMSSLAVLRSLPVDCLKIDQSFVAGLPENDGDAAVVRLVVGLADQLGLSVIAEGVETEAQRALLAELHCENGQGFLFARPMPPLELEARWAEQPPF